MKKVTLISFLIFFVASAITWSVSLFTKLNLYPAKLTSNETVEQVFEDSISLNFWIDDFAYTNTLGNPLQIEFLPTGWMLIFIINIGIPAILGYSFYLKKS